MAVMEMHIFSEVLGLETDIHVIYPNEHDGTPKRALWLLHGGSGDSSAWVRNTAVEQIAEKYNIAVIMPDGMYSCFTDMHKGGDYATYITAELPGGIRGFFPKLSEERQDNFLAGFSNGGYGTFLLGMTAPHLYGALGAFSGGDKFHAEFPRDGSKRSHDMYINFGSEIRGSKYDIERLIQQAAACGGAVPQVYHVCGELEPALYSNYHVVRDLFRSFEGNPFGYEYREYAGYGHTWPLWEAALETFLGEYLKLPQYEKIKGALQTDFFTPWNTPQRGFASL